MQHLLEILLFSVTKLRVWYGKFLSILFVWAISRINLACLPSCWNQEFLGEIRCLKDTIQPIHRAEEIKDKI